MSDQTFDFGDENFITKVNSESVKKEVKASRTLTIAINNEIIDNS